MFVLGSESEVNIAIGTHKGSDEGMCIVQNR